VSAVDSWEAEALADLRHHWDTAYLIHRLGGWWGPQRRDSRETIRAAPGGELRDLSAADSAPRPVPRPAPGKDSDHG
jgi:hypothetical protein